MIDALVLGVISNRALRIGWPGLSPFAMLPLLLPLLVVPVPAMPTPVDFFYLVLLACVMSALTYVVYFQLIASIGATR